MNIPIVNSIWFNHSIFRLVVCVKWIVKLDVNFGLPPLEELGAIRTTHLNLLKNFAQKHLCESSTTLAINHTHTVHVLQLENFHSKFSKFLRIFSLRKLYYWYIFLHLACKHADTYANMKCIIIYKILYK